MTSTADSPAAAIAARCRQTHDKLIHWLPFGGH